MKSLASILIAPFLFLAAAAHAGDTPELVGFRVRVLHNRVRNVLAQRRAALGECAAKAPNTTLFSFNAAIDEELVRPVSADSLTELIALTQESKYWEKASRCGAELARQETALWQRERAKFHSSALFLAEGSACLVGFGFGRGSQCIDTLARLERELDPHCAIDALPNLDGSRDTNPCVAGDRLVYTSLWRGPTAQVKVLDEMDSYLWKFFHAVEAARPGTLLDLGSFHGLGNRKLLIAMLAFFEASSTSSLGYVDGFGEQAWRDGVWRFERPQAIVAHYHEHKARVDAFRDLVAWAAKKKLRLTLADTGADLTNANRHDFMAAFLACHYQLEGQEAVSRLLPRFLGYAYEGLDLVSHLKGGVSLSRSLDNFDDDTNRYVSATRWGRQYCAGP